MTDTTAKTWVPRNPGRALEHVLYTRWGAALAPLLSLPLTIWRRDNMLASPVHFLRRRVVFCVESKPFTQHTSWFWYRAFSFCPLCVVLSVHIARELSDSVLHLRPVPASPYFATTVLIDNDVSIGELGGRHGARKDMRQRDDEEASGDGRSEEGRGHPGPRVQVWWHGWSSIGLSASLFSAPSVPSLPRCAQGRPLAGESRDSDDRIRWSYSRTEGSISLN